MRTLAKILWFFFGLSLLVAIWPLISHLPTILNPDANFVNPSNSEVLYNDMKALTEGFVPLVICLVGGAILNYLPIRANRSSG